MLYLIFIIILFLVPISIIYALFEAHWIKHKKIMIHSDKLPIKFNNTKIVFLTDIHHGFLFSVERLKKVVERVNNLNPDIILLGGDYVDRSEKYIESCFKELQHLKAKLGVYGVLGNHDHWENTSLTRKCMSDAGITLLDNRAVWIKKDDEKIKLGGLGDYKEDKQDIRPTISDTNTDDFVILLTHNPDSVEDINTDKLDIVFAGHTHGGQITIYGLWAPVLPSNYGQKYRSGTLNINNMKLIISNVIGTASLPLRFFARPQIITAKLKTGKK